MNSPAFDTHRAVKMLQQAGAEEPLAEAVVATIGTAVTANVASKADVKELGRELSEEISEVKRELSGRMDGFERDMGDIRKEMKILEHRITIRLGLMMLGGFSILAVLIKL